MNEDADAKAGVRCILAKYVHERTVNTITSALTCIMHNEVDKNDGTEFVRLMQKWLAAV